MRQFPTTTLLLFATLIAFITGCDDPDIQVYEAPRDEPPPRDILWKLPDGWRETPSTEPMRYATLLAGEGDDQIEVSITHLPGQAGGVRANTDRWRRQLGLPPATDEDFQRETRPLQTPTGTAYIVVINGPGAADAASTSVAKHKRLLGAVYPLPGGTWFIKMMGPAPIVQKHADAFAHFALSVRFPNIQAPPAAAAQPSAPTVPSAPQGTAMPMWTVPQNWLQHQQPVSSMAIASFQAGADPQSPIVTITRLGPRAGSVLQNVNRWRRQVNLPPLASENQLRSQTIETPAGPILYFDIAGPQASLLVGIQRLPTATWFYKLAGEPQAVASQEQAFKTFLGSIRFPNSQPHE